MVGDALDGDNIRVGWLISRRYATEVVPGVGLSLDDGTKVAIECYKEP